MWQLVYINWFNIFGLLTTIVAYKWSTKWYLEDLLHSWPNFYPGLKCSFKLQVNWAFMSNVHPSNLFITILTCFFKIYDFVLASNCDQSNNISKDLLHSWPNFYHGLRSFLKLQVCQTSAAVIYLCIMILTCFGSDHKEVCLLNFHRKIL